MSEKETGVVEQVETKEYSPEMNAEEILAIRDKEESSLEEKPSSEETTTGETGEVVKAQPEETGVEPEKPVEEPKKWELERISKLSEQRRQADERAIRAEYELEQLKKAEVKPESETKFDPNNATAEDWDKRIANQSKEAEDRAYQRFQQDSQEKEMMRWREEQTKEAERLSKDTFKVEFGQLPKYDSKGTLVSSGSIDNPNTAAGIMYGYLKTHPEDIGLGNAKILRLAMSEKGYETAKQQGIQTEKQRNETLKAVAMEGAPIVSEDKVPTSSDDAEFILAYKEKHPDWSPTY